ncbi:hypothetical protein D3C83_241720 [compost metagenome]
MLRLVPTMRGITMFSSARLITVMPTTTTRARPRPYSASASKTGGTLARNIPM